MSALSGVTNFCCLQGIELKSTKLKDLDTYVNKEIKAKQNTYRVALPLLLVTLSAFNRGLAASVVTIVT